MSRWILTVLVWCHFTSILTAAANRPNILWFVVDDMSANFSCYGETAIQTPHVDQLAREGTRFTHAFVTAPVCSPCRSAMITGMYQTSIGAHHHRSGRGDLKIRLPEGVEPIPALLQRAGYYTCLGSGLRETNQAGRVITALGKTDYNFEWDRKIYDANDWAGRKPGQPFFMQVQLPGGKLRGNTTASAKRLSDRAARTFGEAVSPENISLPPHYPDDSVLLRDWAAYLDTCRVTDQHVGRVVDRLRQEGILDETLILFMTDHGISHARGKQFLYDEGTHIPFVARGPGVAQGAVREDLIEHIDMAAITLAAAGVPLREAMQARDVLAKDYTPREAIYAARDRCDETVERLRSVRTSDYLYIRNFYPRRPMLQPNAYKDGKSILQRLRSLHRAGRLSSRQDELLFAAERSSEELYLWKKDRWQHTNLAGYPAHDQALKTLRQRLDRWMEETQDRGPESDAMYDSDMAVYLNGRGIGDAKKITERNIALMKQWAKEGI